MTVKTSKLRMFCSPIDILSMAEEIGTEVIDLSSQSTAETIMFLGQVENKIIEADSIILGKLCSIYGNDNATTNNYRGIVPFCTRPFAQKSGHTSNTGNGYLLSVQANYQASSIGYTAGWILSFTDADTYTLTSTLEGSQGGGDITANISSTNGDITVLIAAWIAGITAWVAGDKLYFSFVDCKPLIYSVSKWLATSFALSTLRISQSETDSDVAKQLYTRAMRVLDALSDPDKPGGMKLDTLPTLDVKDIQIDYPIDEFGETDSTGHQSDRTSGYSA